MGTSNVVLIVTVVIFAILTLIGAFYFLVHYQHPEDKWVAWFPKFIVVGLRVSRNQHRVTRIHQVLGFSLACYNMLLLPLDVANRETSFKEIQLENVTLTSSVMNLTTEDDTLDTNSTVTPLNPPNRTISNIAFVETAGLPMDTITFIFSVATIALSLGLIPFAMFYYEGDNSMQEDAKGYQEYECSMNY
jgi:LMBR1 domain-containing protein 1